MNYICKAKGISLFLVLSVLLMGCKKKNDGYEARYLDNVEIKGKNYCLFYLNDDDIPEFAVYGDGMVHNDFVEIYTIYNDMVVNMGEYGEYGCIQYKEREGIIYSQYINYGGIFTDIYEMNGDKLEEKTSLWKSTDDEGKYLIDDEETDEETYSSILNTYSNDLKYISP